MNDITHQILSQVHHLLSIATKEELLHAANLPNTSSNLRGALALLAAEKASTSKREKPRSSGSLPASHDSSGRQKLSATAKLDTLSRELAKSFEKLGKNEIQQACRAVGLHFPMNAKDARERILRRVAKSLSQMPRDRRDSILSALRTKADSQTEGWVGVIRKGR